MELSNRRRLCPNRVSPRQLASKTFFILKSVPSAGPYGMFQVEYGKDWPPCFQHISNKKSAPGVSDRTFGSQKIRQQPEGDPIFR